MQLNHVEFQVADGIFQLPLRKKGGFMGAKVPEDLQALIAIGERYQVLTIPEELEVVCELKTDRVGVCEGDKTIGPCVIPMEIILE